MDLNNRIKEEILNRTISLLPKHVQRDIYNVIKSGDDDSIVVQLFKAIVHSFNEISEEFSTEQIGAFKAVLAYMLKDREKGEILIENEILAGLESYNVTFQRTEDGNCIVRLVGLN